MTPLIQDLREPPVVGRFYMVPVVHHVWHNAEADWPVLGPMHTDADFFNFHDRHYHVDARFVPSALVRKVAGSTGGDIVGAAQAYPLAKRRFDKADLPAGRPALKRMKCRLASLPYKFGHQPNVQKMRSHYGAVAEPIIRPDGRKLCPHRKVDLSQFEPDAEGIVTCPLHGLRVRCAVTQGQPA